MLFGGFGQFLPLLGESQGPRYPFVDPALSIKLIPPIFTGDFRGEVAGTGLNHSMPGTISKILLNYCRGKTNSLLNLQA
jgi:hypothetical protein